MPRRIIKQSPPITPLYDDALPSSLKFEGVFSDAEKTLRIRKNAFNAPLSPYIIHLEREGSTKLAPAQNPLEALAQSLITDPDLLLEEEEGEENDDLSVDFLDLTEQLRHPSLQLVKDADAFTQEPIMPKKSLAKPSEADFSRHLPQTLHFETSQTVTDITVEDLLFLIDLLETAEIAPKPLPDPLFVDESFEEPTKRQSAGFIIHEPETIRFETGDDEVNVKQKWHLPTLQFAPSRLRAAAAFVFLSFAFVLPIHALERFGGFEQQQTEITDAGKAAIDHFMRGASALEADRFDVAKQDFVRASDDFLEAEKSLTQMNTSVAGLLALLPQTDKTYSSVRNLTDAGSLLARAAALMAEAGNDISASKQMTVIQKMRLMQEYAKKALPEIQSAQIALKGVDASVLPEEYRETIVRIQETSPVITASMQEFIAFSDTIAMVLGDNREMRYLVTFQNNTELRPTGGFIGSFAEMNLLNGQISSVSIPPGGTYDLQGQLGSFIAAPKPLGLLSPRWQFHDANWFPDFPQSSKKLLQFYREAGGPTVDGVIAINATTIPALLEVLGPVDMPSYGRTITAENFLFETQKIVEIEYDQFYQPEDRVEEAPKQFIGDLAPILLERIKDADMTQLMAIADLLGKSLTTKDVQIYFEHPSLQAQMETLGWSGSIKQTSGDYLMVVNTNLGGGKTDTVIDQEIDLDVHIAKDGTVTNTVTIRKEHKGLKTALFEGLNNVDYIRLYVPEGSTLLKASGFEIPPEHLFEASDIPLEEDKDLAFSLANKSIDPESQTDIWQEQGKTVFGNWIQTKPGEVETAVFVYELPFKVMTEEKSDTLLEKAKTKLGFRNLETYTLFLQKQSGVVNRDTSISLDIPSNHDLIWSSHEAEAAGNHILIENEKDSFLRFILERREE